MLISEVIAVCFGVLYLLLAMAEQPLCWVAGFISTAIFAKLYFQSHLYMDTLLQAYYMAMAYIGWRQWRVGGENHSELTISSLSLREHALILTAIIFLSYLSETLLLRYTDANFPFLDSILAWGGVITTMMVARKIIENWLYWIVLDALAIGLYCAKALYLTAGLSVVYAILASYGYVIWQRRFNASKMINNTV